ncbi:MAG: sel1 repeat family protein, partial [Muribaculaceae bacterium]|nr:sel1 repeat family protein [Muribaculaceae bacterium]
MKKIWNIVDNAKAGNARAQALVARCYANGTDSVKKNYQEAVKWAQKSADQGDAVGLYQLGVHYDKGMGVVSNYTKANSLYKQALAKLKVEAEN